jgi:hypothetical protein
MIDSRVKALAELRDTEKTYLSVLEGFDLHVRPIFSKIKFTPKELGGSLLSVVGHILNVHRQLYGELEKLSIHYMTKVGKTVTEYVRLLRSYSNYVQAQKQVSPFVAKAMLLPALAPLFQELKDSDYGAGQGLDDILIVPIQRSQRYITLLKDLLAATPKKHPDRALMKKGTSVCSDTLRKLASESAAIEGLHKMSKLDALFEERVNVIVPSRNLVNSYVVQCKRQKYTLIIFSDEFWPTQLGPTGRFVPAKRSSYPDVGVWPVASRSVLVRSDGSSDSRFVFESAATRDSFLADFRRTSVANQQNLREQIQLETESKLLSIALPLHCHSMVFCCDTLWIYSGIDKRGVAQGAIRKIPVANFQVFVRPYNQATDPKPRFGAAVCAVESLRRIYVFGGSDGTTVFNDMWRFDIATCLWTQVSPTRVPPACSGYNLNLVSPEDLLLSGGSPKLAFFRFALADERRLKSANRAVRNGRSFRSPVESRVYEYMMIAHHGRNPHDPFTSHGSSRRPFRSDVENECSSCISLLDV